MQYHESYRHTNVCKTFCCPSTNYNNHARSTNDIGRSCNCDVDHILPANIWLKSRWNKDGEIDKLLNKHEWSMGLISCQNHGVLGALKCFSIVWCRSRSNWARCNRWKYLIERIDCELYDQLSETLTSTIFDKNRHSLLLSHSHAVTSVIYPSNSAPVVVTTSPFGASKQTWRNEIQILVALCSHASLFPCKLCFLGHVLCQNPSEMHLTCLTCCWTASPLGCRSGP